MGAGGGGGTSRHFPDSSDHQLFAIVEPFILKGVEDLPAKFLCHGQDLAFSDSCSPNHGQIVSPPLLRDPDTHLTQTDDVRDVFVVLLGLYRRKDKCPFLINVAGVPHIGGRLSVAAISLVRLDPNGELVYPLVIDNRDQDGVVSRVRASMVRRVV